jgi:Mg-chelatase subunit ChlD
VAIELVLDTSGSMRERLGRQRSIDVAKGVLARLVAEQLAPGTPVALRTFRPEPRSCESDLVVPLGPLDPAAMGTTIDALEAVKTVQTPLAAAIASVAEDLSTAEGPRIVVVVSDGRETCGGDPEAAVRSLVEQGFDVSVNVVGLGLDRKSRREVARLAKIGQGTYYDASDAEGLAAALKRATGAPFTVLDAAGVEIARGTVDGRPVAVPPGTYRVALLGAASSLDVVVIESGAQETVTVAR